MSDSDEYKGFPGDVIIPSKTLTFDREGQPTASVSLFVPRADAQDIACGMITDPPHHWPGIPNLLCKTASIQELGCGGDCAQIDLSYDCYDFPITETVDIGVQMQTLPPFTFAWFTESGSFVRKVMQGEEPCRQIRTQEISRSFSNSVIPRWCLQNQGCVNGSAVQTFSCNCAPETLLYKGATASRTIQKGAIIMWNISCKYGYNPNGWNKYYNNILGQYYCMHSYNVKTQQWSRYRMYPMADLSQGFPGTVSGLF